MKSNAVIGFLSLLIFAHAGAHHGKAAESNGVELTRTPVSARVKQAHKMAHAGPIGNVIVKFADGTEDQWTLKGNCSTPKVSPGGVVGWIVYSLLKDGKSIESYDSLPVNGKITICKKGKVLVTVSTSKAFIEQWGFTNDGLHFVAKSRGAHGPATIQLFSFTAESPVAEAPAYSENLPEWARPYKD